MKRILIASDLSARSELALRRAVSLAREFGTELELLHVSEETFFEDMTQKKASLATAALKDQLNAIPEAEGMPIRVNVLVGIDFEQILLRADQIDADIIVIGTHRHAEREMFRGTTAERVIRYGTRPVLVVRNEVKGPYRRTLVASDLSRQATAAAEAAAQLSPGGEMLLVHAVQRPFSGFLDLQTQDALVEQDRAFAQAELDQTLAQTSARMGHRAPAGRSMLPEGPVRETLSAAIDAQKPDLLALGTHGRGGIAHAVLGSIAEEFLASSPVDVLAVKAPR